MHLSNYNITITGLDFLYICHPYRSFYEDNVYIKGGIIIYKKNNEGLYEYNSRILSPFTNNSSV